VASFSSATDQMIDHFDLALTDFESDVRAGKANVRVTHKFQEAMRAALRLRDEMFA
jgi:hypothetical protein